MNDSFDLGDVRKCHKKHFFSCVSLINKRVLQQLENA